MPAKKKRGPRPRHEDAAGQILDAADALFCEHGFPSVSMRDVAEKADVNKALIFYYYNNKVDLFATVLERYYRSHAEILEGAIQTDGEPRQRLHQFLDVYLDFMDKNRRYARLVQQEVARGGEHLPLIRKNFQLLFARTEVLLKDVLPKKAKGHMAAKHLFLTLSGMTINYFTYAPVLRPIWGGSLMSAAARTERRAHVHWVVDSLLDAYL